MAQDAKTHKLDLEFEEEDANASSQNDVPEEVNLEFSATAIHDLKKVVVQTQAISPVENIPEEKIPENVRSIDARRRKMTREERVDYFRKKRLQERQNLPAAQTPPKSSPQKTPLLLEDDGTGEHQIPAEIIADESEAAIQSMSAPRSTDADIRVAIAETKGRLYGEYLSEAKLVEFKILQLCKRIAKDCPETTKKQLAQIEKLITEYRKKIIF